MTLRATVDKNHKGFGFLIFDDRGYEDLFLPPRQAESFFHGDRVEVHLGSRGKVDDVRVLEHRFRELVGRYMLEPGARGRGWIIYERKRAREEVFIPQLSDGLQVKAGDWVRARLHFHEKGPHAVTGEILEVFGKDLPPRADLEMIAAEYNLIEAHSAAAVREAEGLRLEVPGKDLEGREDLRKLPLITIDGETARDFDDAVYVERDRSGFVLWVGIADVSHYVTPGSALDREAHSRGTSVYFPERAFHMLPRELSENLCSLRPNQPRLAMVARMEFDSQGARRSVRIMEAVIESRRRATYNEIQAEREQNIGNKNWEFSPHFELYERLRAQRIDRGSLDFEFPEAELHCEPTGEISTIGKRDRLEAHRLIEEFMIAANEAVTEWMMERSRPFVYRVHAEPSAEALQRFIGLAETVGIHFAFEDSVSPIVLSDALRSLEGHPAQALLNTALLRSLKQAIYSAEHGIHYGLASEAYTHFTSPIRRYPDLVVHRLLRAAIREEGKKPSRNPPAFGKKKSRHRLSIRSADEAAFEKQERELAEVCEHCSYRERLAADAERESIRLKQVRVMEQHLGAEFDAKVVGMVEPGLFAELSEPFVEGFVSKESMTDDFYEFDERRMVFRGKRKKRMIKIGDQIRIRVLAADVGLRKIDFGMIDAGKGS